MRKSDGPKGGDVVIWSVKGAAPGGTSYVVFKIGQPAAPRHYEGANIWGKVFSEAKRSAQQHTVWLREGLGPPWRLIEATAQKGQD